MTRSSRGLSTIVIWLLFVCSFLYTIEGRPDYTGLPPGPYCGSSFLRLRCCEGRQDDCSVPIFGTLCYCDDFCSNRTREEDCCPDFWSFCKGMKADPGIDIATPLTRCQHRGKIYEPSETFKENCNTCKCSTIDGKAEILCERNRCLIEQEILDRVNIVDRSSWKATNYTEFWGHTLEEGITFRLGTLNPHQSVQKMHKMRRHYDPTRLPRKFNAEETWRREIAKIRDQGWCGASWAISTVDVASDRFTIATKGAQSVELGPQHLISCNRRGQRGCKGGYVERAWLFIRKFGLTDDDCCPWVSSSSKGGGQRGGKLSDADWRERQSYERKNRTYRIGPPFRLVNETDIMYEILIGGPVQATMRVYQDFFAYEGGIYKHSSLVEDYPTGYHSVRVIGWGEKASPITGQPIKYWLVANSWGQKWGEWGYFKLERGTNECEIESYAVGVLAKPV